jgi:hypothetical protein
MPTDEMKQRIAEMKEACTQAVLWNSVEAADFRQLATPAAVLAIINENEALTRELATACRHGQVLSEEVDRLYAAKKEIEEIAAGMADVNQG